MAYVPGCRYDLFISYDSVNNREGWIQQFEHAVGAELADLLGRQFDPKESIFFDNRELRIGSFPDQLSAAARDSAMLIPVLSPGYLDSTWCDRERTEFFSRLPHGAAPKDCLAPILFRPLDETELPTLFREAQRVSFLPDGNESPFPPGSPEFVTRVGQFAGQLKKALQGIRLKCKPVFVGKPGVADRSRNLRAQCCRELERRDFRTIPPMIVLGDPQLVLARLQEASLALHFLGGTDEVTRRAIEESPRACKGPTILYQPFGADLTPDEEYWLRVFEDEVQSDPGQYQRLAGKNDQELLALIDEQITQSPTTSTGDRPQFEVALVCEEVDLERVRQLRNDLCTRGAIEASYPQFLGTRLKAMDCLRKLQAFLKSGENLVFYHGLAERESLQSKWRIAQQYRPMSALHWYSADPDLEGKRQRYPDDLWNIDQVIRLVRRAHGAGQ